ncbi:MAG TPA: hypothetical protein VG165_11100 [Solirubrobacteraceae bacterium]|nr:hypothetical protein [Solirubrobacteraceae bacterium]
MNVQIEESGENMNLTRRITPLALAATIGIGAVAMPATAATAKATKYTTKQCTAYKAGFLKRHKKPTKAELAAANKVLKKHGCTIKA